MHNGLHNVCIGRSIQISENYNSLPSLVAERNLFEYNAYTWSFKSRGATDTVAKYVTKRRDAFLPLQRTFLAHNERAGKSATSVRSSTYIYVYIYMYVH